MQNITSVTGLKNAIQLMEVEQAVKGQLLKEQLYFTLESLKPANLIKGAVKDLASSPYLFENILGASLGLASGYLSKKIVVGLSGSIFRKLFGSIVQVGVTGIVAQHPDTIKSIGQFILQHVFHRKQLNAKKP
jgi:hypothetical protein